MSSSLTNGLVVVIRKIGHRGHRTSLSLGCHVWGFMKNKVYEGKVNITDELYNRILDAARRRNEPDVRKVHIIPKFKYP
jgi:hypothetical protein